MTKTQDPNADEFERIVDAGSHLLPSEPPEDAIPVELPKIEPEQVSPLDTKINHNLELGLIDQYANLVTEMTQSPREFNQLGALMAASTAIKGKAFLRMSFATIKPNIYGCIVAPSSVFHKSSSLNFVSRILNRAFFDNLLMASQFTSEGLTGALSSRPEGLIIRDEIGTLFANNKKYNADLKPDLTRLYDGGTFRRQLSNETIKVENPYLCLFGATTPAAFYESVSLRDWRDGLMMRFLFVLPEGDPDFDTPTMMYQEKHDQELGRLAMELANLGKRESTEFKLTTKAHNLWDRWHRSQLKKAYFYDSDIAAPLVTRYSTYALKFALILAAVNGDWGSVNESTMQTAISLADNYKSYAHKLMAEKSQHQVSGGKLQKILKIVWKLLPQTEGKGVTTKAIMQHAKMSSGELKPCLEKMVDCGALTEESVGRGFRYTPNVEKLTVRL